MLISLEWLGQYVDLQGLQPEVIAEALTGAGLEVESIQTPGCVFSGVKVGRIVAIEPHPNADRLRLVTVELGEVVLPHPNPLPPREGEGSENSLKVVCGAANVREGMAIAFASVGSQVANKQTGLPYTLEKARIRGVESTGMICSIEELAMQDRYAKQEDGGVWELDPYISDVETVLGQDLKEALGLKTDVILDVAPTANRGDLMSMLGVAREVAALFDRALTLPNLEDTPHPASGHPLPQGERGKSLHLEDPTVCGYYGALIIRNVHIGPSPDWMATRLEAAGVRAINNVVDITNYVMLELGQPLHAFDLEKLGDYCEIPPSPPPRGNFTIGVRKAKPGETLTTLDGVTRQLAPDSVVITRNDAPVAMAGVMGGEDTEISETSTHLFLESAYFPPASSRRSAKSIGLRTEASARFERGVDPEMSRKALFRALTLLQDLAGVSSSADEGVSLIETAPIALQPLEIPLRLSRIPRILGITPDQGTTRMILSRLGFQIGDVVIPDVLPVFVPSYRREDICREIDLIEEIIRIYGYDRVPYTLPRKTGTPAPSLRQNAIARMHRTLRAAGLQEVVTNSLIGPQLLEKTGFASSLDGNKGQSSIVTVTNSHSPEHTLMRQSLLPNLIEIAKFNQAQGNETVWIYELGRVYFKIAKTTDKNAGVIEKLYASGLLIGLPDEGQWRLSMNQRDACDFYDLKGAIEQMLQAFQLEEETLIQPVSAGAHPHLHPGRAAELLLAKNKKPLGAFGELHPTLQDNLKFRRPVYVFEVDMEAFLKALPQGPAAGEIHENVISPYPAVDRDMAFSAPQSVSHGNILETIRQLQEPLLKDIVLFDEYRGAQIGEGQRSLAYRLTLQSDRQTLTEDMIDAAILRIKSALSDRLPVAFR